jgi:hypothetical protein
MQEIQRIVPISIEIVLFQRDDHDLSYVPTVKYGCGRVFAGISVSGSSWRTPLPDSAGLSKVVIHHANVISAALGFRI